MVAITSIVNAGSGVYHITFNQAVTVISAGAQENNLLGYSPSNQEAVPGNVYQLTADSITWANVNGDSDDNLFFFIGTPVNLTAADAWPIISPTYT